MADAVLVSVSDHPTETHSLPSTTAVALPAKTGPPLQTIPSQTATRALTTIFTPPARCGGRYYVEAKQNGYYTERGIFSDISDRLYRSCQPDPQAYSNYYSPGVCPSNMDIAAVLSSPSNGTAGVTYTDICCQRHVSNISSQGFVWDSLSCCSIVPTTTTVLIAPAVSTQDLYVPVDPVQAWHPPIMAVWQTIDLSLFPSDVMSQKSCIAEYGWPPHSASTTAPTRLKSNEPSAVPGSPESITSFLGIPAIVAISIIAPLFLVFLIALFEPCRRRRQSELGESEPAIFTGPQQSSSGNTWNIEVGPPPPDELDPGLLRTLFDKRRREQQQAAESDSQSVLVPLSGLTNQRRESIRSPISDQVAPPNQAP
ncbi:hypothetical protein F4825DRAFT_446084 [Nemania diffusa]|nr:hypothetical protein F4825DRAFT_446084 [Nemania diffusa]